MVCCLGMISLFSLLMLLGVIVLLNKCFFVGEFFFGLFLGKLGGVKVVDVFVENVFWSRLKDLIDSLVFGLDDLYILRI